MNRPLRDRLPEWLVTLPPMGWLAALFLLPTALIFAISLRPADPFGGIGAGWTLDHIRALATHHYAVIAARTVLFSLLTTAICLFLALPTVYYIARAPGRWRQTLLLLVVVPFWTSFLIRIFAWKVLLHPDGLFKQALAFLHLVPADAALLYHPPAVLLVMVYTCLPFAILPVYAAAEKFDFQLLEAARDLGAGRFQAFMRVFVPGIRRGVLTAVLVVLIPALGTYVIPDLVGGPTSEMIGNKIAQRVFVDRNLPHAGALAALLTLGVLLPMAAVLVLQARGRRRAPTDEEGL